MTDRDALVAAVAAAPGDDLPRLVFADWLEETGDPAQAAFVRGHVALARMKPGDPRRGKLAVDLQAAAVRHAADWVAPLCAAFGQPRPMWPVPGPTGRWLGRLGVTLTPLHAKTSISRPHWADGGLVVPCQEWDRQPGTLPPLQNVVYRRGLPDSLNVTARLAPGGDGFASAFRSAPLTGLALDGIQRREQWKRADGPWLAGLRTLTLTSEGDDAAAREALAAVFRSPQLTGLRALGFWAWQFPAVALPSAAGTMIIDALAVSPLASRLRVLRVMLVPGVVRGLAAYPRRSPLEELCPGTLSGLGMLPDNWRQLADLPFRPSLRRLSLANCSLTDEGLAALCRGPRWESLVALRLDSNLLTDAGGVALARLAPFPKLQALRLDRNRLGDDAARALARSPLVRTLWTLDLSHNPITAEGALPLAVALAEGPLVRLRLSGNPISRRRRHRIRDILRDRVVLDR